MEHSQQSSAKDLRTGVPPQALHWSAVFQGGILEVRKSLNWSQIEGKNTPRGRCAIYSRASRLRLLKRFARIDWDKVDGILLITLTYPDQVGHVPYAERTRQRAEFHRRLERFRGQQTAMVWRTEHMPRRTGARKGEIMPHTHLLVFTSTFVPWQEVRQWWADILGHDGPLATDVRRVRTGSRAAIYAAKYAAKPSLCSLDNAAYLRILAVGRPWGVLRAKLVPLHPRVVMRDLSEAEAKRVRRILDLASPPEHPYQGGSYTAWGKLAQLGYAGLRGELDIDVGGD